MKRTQLVKHLAKKIAGQMQQAGTPGRFAQDANAVPDRREQRKMDQAAGLMPFAVKLHADLARQLRELAEQEGGNLNALVDRLIRAGLTGSAAPVAAPIKADAKATAGKPAAVKKMVVKAPVKAPVKEPAKKAAAKKPVTTTSAPKQADKKEDKKVTAKKAVAVKVPAKKAAAKVAKPKAVKTKA